MNKVHIKCLDTKPTVFVCSVNSVFVTPLCLFLHWAAQWVWADHPCCLAGVGISELWVRVCVCERDGGSKAECVWECQSLLCKLDLFPWFSEVSGFIQAIPIQPLSLNCSKSFTATFCWSMGECSPETACLWEKKTFYQEMKPYFTSFPKRRMNGLIFGCVQEILWLNEADMFENETKPLSQLDKEKLLMRCEWLMVSLQKSLSMIKRLGPAHRQRFYLCSIKGRSWAEWMNAEAVAGL